MPDRRRFRLQPTLGVAGLAALLAAPAAVSALPTKVPNIDPHWDSCAAAVARQEIRLGIPRGLMQAISRAESGKWNGARRAKLAWPWTVYAEGKGRYLPTKSFAAAEIYRLRQRGVDNIDVGCMQVNLMHHPKAFATAEHALDPDRNAAYAAVFLVSLKQAHGSWRTAVQRYHSATPARQAAYLGRVYTEWRKTTTSATRTPVRQRVWRGPRRTGRRTERPRGMTLADYRRQTTGAIKGKPPAPTRSPVRLLANWPPRNAKAQRRAENRARARAQRRRK